MGVNIKIYPYRKKKVNAFNKVNIIDFTAFVPSGLNTNYYTWTPYTEFQIQYIDILYGLAGRMIASENEGWTYAYLGNPPYFVGSGGVYLVHPYGWSGNVPVGGNRVESHVHYKDDYRYLRYAGEELNCETKLLDQEITINFRLETDRVFDLESSYGEFIINADTEVKTFFDTYWSTFDSSDEYENLFGVEIFLDGVSEAWMCSRKADIIYDKLEENYKIKCYDWAKIQLEEIGNQWCPNMDYDFEDVPVTYFLDKIFDEFKVEGISTVSDLGDLVDTFNRTEYRGRNYVIPGTLGDLWWVSPEMSMTVSQFLTEIQKHYAAFVYYDKNRVLRIRRRDYQEGDGIVIDNLIQESTFEEVIRLRGNIGLIVNFTEPGYAGWSSVEADPTSPNGLKIDTGLSEADVQRRESYLDLRQELPYPTFETTIFEYRGTDKRYADYEELLIDLKQYRCTVDSLIIDLFTKIIYNGVNYRVVSVSKNYLKEESELEFIKI